MITAKELSERFEVSRRTIYRDIDTLSATGIPVYTNKGKGGGISLIENFVLNKSMLSDQEQDEILMSLQSLNAMAFSNIEPVLNKLSVLFKKRGKNWIDVDFSRWASDDRAKFNVIKTAILSTTVISFDYFSSAGEKTTRTVEPLKLIFRGQSWYLYSFCRNKNNFRMFKIPRIKNLTCSSELFNRNIPDNIWSNFEQAPKEKMVTLVLRIDARMAYRIYDEFEHESIVKNIDESYTVTVNFPENDWVYGYVLSYSNYAEVLEPKHIRESVKERFEKGLKKYL